MTTHDEQQIYKITHKQSTKVMTIYRGLLQHFQNAANISQTTVSLRYTKFDHTITAGDNEVMKLNTQPHQVF